MYLTRKRGLSLFIALMAGLCAVELWVATSPYFQQHTAVLGFAITADLLVGIPLLFYGLIVRPFRLSPVTLAPAFLLAVVIAGRILPPAGRTYLDMVKALVPLLELTLLAVVCWKARGIYQHFRHARQREIYFIDALEASTRASFGDYPALKLLTVELSLIFLAFFGWFMSFRARHPSDKVFTYHRKSLYPAIFLMLLLLVALETLVLHLLIQRWSPPVAWVLTGLSVYSIFWIIGDFNAIRLNPIVLAGETLHLRSGFRWSARLELADILELRAARRSETKAADYLSFALAGEPQLVIVLKQPVRVKGLFGIEKQVSRIGLFVDDLAGFRAELERCTRVD